MNQIDITIFRWLNSWAGISPFFDWAIMFRAQYLWYVMIFSVLLFPLFTFLPRFREYRRRNFFIFAEILFSALFARFVFANLIRFFYNRPRPFEALEGVRQLIDRPSGGSFPSGHASLAFAVATTVSLYYPRTSILFFFASFSVGVARVAAGAHWPSDILGGAIVGIVAAWFIRWCFRKYGPQNK